MGTGSVERIFRYLLFMLPGCCMAAAAFLPARRRIQGGASRRAAMLLFWIFSGGMAAITLVPEPGWLLSAIRGDGAMRPYFDLSGMAARTSLIPFSHPDSLFNIAGNIVMFLPFGFFAALLWRGFTGRRALSLGLGLTCSIECWQLLVGRHFDIDDILLNTLGVWCGYLLWRLTERYLPAWTRRFHVMDSITLVPPAMEHRDQVLALKAELLAEGGSFDGCAGLGKVDTYEEWLDFDGRNAKKGWAPSHVWLGVRQSDGMVVGIIDYRSPLTDFLLQYGGNIGYSIRPSQRRRGYAKQMLRLTLDRCREAGERRVLVTCDRGNLASARTILANGGVLENEVEDKPGLGRSGVIQRYWITLE